MDLPVMQWMARWAAMAISRFKVGKDRCTAYERQRGKRCSIEVLPEARQQKMGMKSEGLTWKLESGLGLYEPATVLVLSRRAPLRKRLLGFSPMSKPAGGGAARAAVTAGTLAKASCIA